ncbi:MAG TPA: 3-dehydroquinate synthase [Polyangia bacterium]|nr:3-dehydroquinate synthase [Polyangia bacterium]
MISRVDVTLPPRSEDRSYTIVVDPDAGADERCADALCALFPTGRFGIVSDETVAKLYLPRFADALRARGRRVAAAVVPDGEGSKSFATTEEVCESFAREGLDRGAVLVALGGGVVGDLGGFVAAIFMRGIPYVQLPTTLLAQVDSSVGGKTGVNLASGKNLAGAFWQPRLVYADVTTLATLSERDRVAGLAEVVKHALIADADMLTLLEQRAADARAGEPSLTAELVARSCRIKAAVVGDDEFETTGARARLNFGHTVGHALESDSHKEHEPLRHGEAVALGMIAATRVNRALGGADLEPRVTALLSALGLPVDLDRRLSPGALARVAVDKKRGGDHIGFIVVDEPGSSRVTPIAPSRIHEILLGRKTR